MPRRGTDDDEDEITEAETPHLHLHQPHLPSTFDGDSIRATKETSLPSIPDDLRTEREIVVYWYLIAFSSLYAAVDTPDEAA